MGWHDGPEDDEVTRLPTPAMLRRIFPFVRPYLPSFLTAFVLGLSGVALTLAQPVVLRNIIDDDFATGDSSGLVRHGLMYVSLLVGGSLCGGGSSILLGRSGVLAVNQIKRVVFSHFLSLGLPWIEKHPVGTLMSRVESDSQRLVSLCSTLLMHILSPLAMLVGAVLIIWNQDQRLFLIALIFLPVMLAGTVAMFSIMRPRFRRERKLYGELSGQVAELVPASRLLQALGRRDWAEARLEAMNTVYLRFTTKLHFYENGFWSGIGFVEIGLTCVGLWLGVGWVADGSMTTGTLVMFAQYAAMVYWPILALSEQLAEIQRAGGAADRVFELLDLDPTVATPAEPRPIPTDGDLTFHEVHFAYEEDKPVLRGVSFTVPAGKTVAIVGATGSGKTTIINLLMRFRDPTAGRITLGDVDLRDMDPLDYRRRFGLVLQDLYLFPAPVIDNLRAFRNDIDREQVRQAASQAGILELLDRRTDGLDGMLAEGGADLSYGQRQLVAFARALAVDPEFLVLDEATSSVDPGTELRIQETLQTLTRHRTSVIVAHRLTTIRRAHEILVLERGELVERGDHATLVRRGGIHARMVALQESPGSGEAAS